MKKIVLLAILAMTISLSSRAQANYDKGNFILSAGFGFGYYYAGGTSFQINGEYFFTDKLSIGPYLGFTRYTYRYRNPFVNYNYDYTFVDFGARGSYHFSELFGITNENLDIYGGASLGFVVSNYDGPGDGFDDPYGSTVRGGIHAGARYFFTPKFAAYGELGVGYAPLALGVTFKF
jgi:hypothetical protein